MTRLLFHMLRFCILMGSMFAGTASAGDHVYHHQRVLVVVYSSMTIQGQTTCHDERRNARIPLQLAAVRDFVWHQSRYRLWLDMEIRTIEVPLEINDFSPQKAGKSEIIPVKLRPVFGGRLLRDLHQMTRNASEPYHAILVLFHWQENKEFRYASGGTYYNTRVKALVSLNRTPLLVIPADTPNENGLMGARIIHEHLHLLNDDLRNEVYLGLDGESESRELWVHRDRGKSWSGILDSNMQYYALLLNRLSELPNGYAYLAADRVLKKCGRAYARLERLADYDLDLIPEYDPLKRKVEAIPPLGECVADRSPKTISSRWMNLGKLTSAYGNSADCTAQFRLRRKRTDRFNIECEVSDSDLTITPGRYEGLVVKIDANSDGFLCGDDNYTLELIQVSDRGFLQGQAPIFLHCSKGFGLIKGLQGKYTRLADGYRLELPILTKVNGPGGQHRLISRKQVFRMSIGLRDRDLAEPGVQNTEYLVLGSEIPQLDHEYGVFRKYHLK